MEFLDSKGNHIALEDLPRLVVLTGLNGSGKTRGLKQLKEKDPEGTAYIHYKEFAAYWDGQNNLSDPEVEEELKDKLNEWKYKGTLSTVRTNFRDIKDVKERIECIEWCEENKTNSEFASLLCAFIEIFPEAKKPPFNNHRELLDINPEKAKLYLSKFKDDTVSTAYKKLCMEGSPAHDVSDAMVMNKLREGHSKMHPLQLNLNVLVGEYYENWVKLNFEKWISESTPIRFETYKQTHPHPIDQINAQLKQLSEDANQYKVENEKNVFNFELQTNWPEELPSYEEVMNPYKRFYVRFVDAETKEERQYGHLSSGEQTLLALTTLIYKHQNMGAKTRLYLDEIDASLHPSMIKGMLGIFNKLQTDMQIFLATHSPTTVALAPEGSLFFVEQGQAKEIEQTEALEGLTQGYMTAEGISSVFRSLRGNCKQIIVISEGNNYEYLEPIFQKVGIAEQCHIHRYKKARKDSKGVTELMVLHQLFCDLINTLPNGQKFVFLVDCEQCKEIAKWDNKGNVHVVALALKEIKANPQKRGIENVVPGELLVELENEVKNKGEKSIYKKPTNPSEGIDRKNLVARKFLDELNRIDIKTLEHTLSDLILLCQSVRPPCPTS